MPGFSAPDCDGTPGIAVLTKRGYNMYSFSIFLSHPWFGQEGSVEHSVSLAFLASVVNQRRRQRNEERTEEYASVPLYHALTLPYL